MDHNDIRHKLSEYLDNAVTDDERTAVEAHLQSCAACADALRELRKTIEHLRAVEEIEPPAWMTAKVMAQVREDAEKKKRWFQWLFYPLAVKLPIQTMALLFLTVSAYYIYTSINPAERYAEAPMATLAKKEVPAVVREEVELRQAEKPLSRTRDQAAVQGPREYRRSPAEPAAAPHREETAAGRARDAASAPAKAKESPVEQAPGYRSLDMRFSYEQPEPPVPAAPPSAASPAARASQEPERKAQSRKERREQTVSDCLPLSPAIVTLQGVITGADAQEGRGRKVWVLRLDAPACIVSPGPGAGKAQTYPVQEIPLTLEDDSSVPHTAPPAGRVRVRGSLVRAPSDGALTPFLLKTLDISPGDK